uniref:Uncharacterized protein n=1 Tax=Fagus sylvatica TaxID=28930 RepID=A0A2N9EGX3_FAGSY
MHSDTNVNILAEVNKLKLRILEHFQTFQPTGSHVTRVGMLLHQLNVDAAIFNYGAAIVARNASGNILQCRSKKIPIFDPCIVRASGPFLGLLKLHMLSIFMISV